MAATEEEKKSNREQLDRQRNNFNNLKRQMSSIEEEEAKTKTQVEEAIKHRNSLDDYCKKIKSKIKENRDKFKDSEMEFGFIFRDENLIEENKVAVHGDNSVVMMSRSSGRQGGSNIGGGHGGGGPGGDDESQNASKRFRNNLSGFEYHMNHTPI